MLQQTEFINTPGFSDKFNHKKHVKLFLLALTLCLCHPAVFLAVYKFKLRHVLAVFLDILALCAYRVHVAVNLQGRKSERGAVVAGEPECYLCPIHVARRRCRAAYFSIFTPRSPPPPPLSCFQGGSASCVASPTWCQSVGTDEFSNLY